MTGPLCRALWCRSNNTLTCVSSSENSICNHLHSDPFYGTWSTQLLSLTDFLDFCLLPFPLPDNQPHFLKARASPFNYLELLRVTSSLRKLVNRLIRTFPLGVKLLKDTLSVSQLLRRESSSNNACIFVYSDFYSSNSNKILSHVQMLADRMVVPILKVFKLPNDESPNHCDLPFVETL